MFVKYFELRYFLNICSLTFEKVQPNVSYKKKTFRLISSSLPSNVVTIVRDLKFSPTFLIKKMFRLISSSLRTCGVTIFKW